jgi:hypothetical protein
VVKLENEHWYAHVPKLAETYREGKVTILRIQQVQTDRTIPDNKPDITVRLMKREPTCLIYDAISGDRKMIKKEAEKILKHEDLTIEIQRVCNVKTKVISSVM